LAQLFRALQEAKHSKVDVEDETRAKLLKLWSEDPWEWLTGQDTDGRPIIWTRDEKMGTDPAKPFPRDKPYLRRLVYRALGPEPLFVNKSRQMIVSTTLMLVADWVCRFQENRNVLVSKQKEGESETLIREKLRSVHSRLPSWLQEVSPLSPTPANRVTYYQTQSTLRGVAQNFAIGEARGTTASIVLIDEAAFQEYTGPIIDAVMAMSSRLWVVTTPRVTGAGAHVFRKLIGEQ
jgi:hypothetical protein